MKTTINIIVAWIVAIIWGMIGITWHPYAAIPAALLAFCIAFILLNKASKVEA